MLGSCKTNGYFKSGCWPLYVLFTIRLCVRWGRPSLTLDFLIPSKGGSQRLTSGAKHPVGSAVAVPHAVPSVGEVLDPVFWQGQFRWSNHSHRGLRPS